MDQSKIRTSSLFVVLVIATFAIINVNSQGPAPVRVDVESIPAEDWEYLFVAYGGNSRKLTNKANEMAQEGWYLYDYEYGVGVARHFVFRRIKKQ